MILKCIGPKGDSCTVRLSTSRYMNTVLRLESLGFTKFEVIPEYRKFHTSRYAALIIGINHWLCGVNRLNECQRLDKMSREAQKKAIQTILDESLQIVKTVQ